MPEEPSSGSAALAGETSEARHLRRAASEMILSASDLTDELTDDEARPLIQWGVMQAEAAADDMARSGQAARDPSGRGLGDILGGKLDPVRRMMKRINRLAGGRHNLPPEELPEELQRLLALAEGLPRPPQPEVAAGPLADLGVRGAELETGALVQAIVGLLVGSASGAKQEQSQLLGQGEEHDKGETDELRRARDCGDAPAGDPDTGPGRAPFSGRRDPGACCS